MKVRIKRPGKLVPPSQAAFGELTVGRWAINPDERTVVWGRCFRCGTARPAHRLIYRVMPFNRDEGWACQPHECKRPKK